MKICEFCPNTTAMKKVAIGIGKLLVSLRLFPLVKLEISILSLNIIYQIATRHTHIFNQILSTALSLFQIANHLGFQFLVYLLKLHL